jgi:hypothetical protein
VSVWKETDPMPFGLRWSHEMEGGLCLLLNSNFCIMLSHITFYRNLIPFSVYHNFSSAYTALSGNAGDLWASKLLRTCIVITVTLPSFYVS